MSSSCVGEPVIPKLLMELSPVAFSRSIYAVSAKDDHVDMRTDIDGDIYLVKFLRWVSISMCSALRKHVSKGGQTIVYRNLGQPQPLTHWESASVFCEISFSLWAHSFQKYWGHLYASAVLDRFAAEPTFWDTVYQLYEVAVYATLEALVL